MKALLILVLMGPVVTQRKLAMLILEGLGEKRETFADIAKALCEGNLGIAEHGIAMVEEKKPAAAQAAAPATPANPETTARLCQDGVTSPCLVARSTIHSREDLRPVCGGCRRGSCVVQVYDDGGWHSMLSNLVRDLMVLEEGPPTGSRADWMARYPQRIKNLLSGIDNLVLTPLDEFPIGCQVVPASEEDARLFGVQMGQIMVVTAHDGDRIGITLEGRAAFYNRTRFTRRA